MNRGFRSPSAYTVHPAGAAMPVGDATGVAPCAAMPATPVKSRVTLASSVTNERRPERMSNDFMDGPLLREAGSAGVRSTRYPEIIAPKVQAWLNASQPPSDLATVVK